jgi:hypothetical protein
MDLKQAVRIWRARWILTCVLLILASGGAAGAAAKVPRSYQSTSSVVLLASHAAAMQNGGNPFLSFGPSLTLTADAVSREIMAPATVSQLAARGFTASYTVAIPSYTTFTTGSVLLVTVTGPHAARVQLTLRAVTAQIGTQLAQLQHGVPAPSQIRAETLSITPQAKLSVSQTARPLVVVGALLLVICLGTPIVVDGLVTRRQVRIRRRSRRSVRTWRWSTSWRSLTGRRSRTGWRSLTGRRSWTSWRSLTGRRSRTNPTIPEELVFPGGATGGADQQVGGEPARGEPRLPSSSWPTARNGGRSRQLSGATGRRVSLGDVSGS